MSSIDTNRFRDALLAERTRVAAALENLRNENPGSVEDETGEETSDQHLADTATAMHDRELDYGLTENEEELLKAIDAALQRIEDGTYGIVHELRQADRRGAARGAAVDRPLHRLREAAMSAPAPRPPGRRAGRLGDGRAHARVGRRALAVRGRPRMGRARRRRGRRRVADQITKRIVAGDARARRVATRRRAVRPAPRAELRHRVRALSRGNDDRDRADRDGHRLAPRRVRAVGRTPPGDAGRARASSSAAASRTSPTACGSGTSRTSSTSTSGRRSTSPTPSSSSASPSCWAPR